MVGFSIANPPPCPPQPATGLSPNDQVLTVQGTAAAPIQQTWTSPFGWWHGPEVSQAWPLTGQLESLFADDPTVRWSWTFWPSPNGTWVTPSPEYVQVIPHETELGAPEGIYLGGFEGVPPNWSIDTAQPAPAQLASIDVNTAFAQPLMWASAEPIAPTARFTDRASLALWQNLLVVAGVGMGIGGAMLASLAYEMLGSPKEVMPEATGEDATVTPVTAHVAAPREEIVDVGRPAGTGAQEPPDSSAQEPPRSSPYPP